MRILTITALALLLVFAGCFSTSKVTVQKRSATFDFSPPTTAASKSSNIAFILIRPKYAPQFQHFGEELFQRFIKSMGADFEEMVVARGFTLRGPYDTYDEIVYSDKTETDLILYAEVDLTITPGAGVIRSTYNALTKSYVYWADGSISLGGKINLTASETLTQEKLWVKSIPLTPKDVYVKSVKRYVGPNIPLEDVGMYNPISEALEDYYVKAINTAWNHLNPAELTTLKKQVDDLRKKKTY